MSQPCVVGTHGTEGTPTVMTSVQYNMMESIIHDVVALLCARKPAKVELWQQVVR